MNEISKAAGQKDIVEAAEDHAKNLEKIAKELEEYVNQMPHERFYLNRVSHL